MSHDDPELYRRKVLILRMMLADLDGDQTDRDIIAAEIGDDLDTWRKIAGGAISFATGFLCLSHTSASHPFAGDKGIAEIEDRLMELFNEAERH